MKFRVDYKMFDTPVMLNYSMSVIFFSIQEFRYGEYGEKIVHMSQEDFDAWCKEMFEKNQTYVKIIGTEKME